MQRLDLVGMVAGVRFGAPSGQIEIVATGTALAPQVTVINHVTGETVTRSVTEGGVGAQTALAAHGGGRVALAVDGIAGSVLAEALDAARAMAGTGSISTFLSGSTEMQTQAVELVSVAVGGASYLFAARPAGAGLAVFEMGTGTGLTARGSVADTAGTYAGGISALAAVQVGTRGYLYAGSSTEDGVQAWRIDPGGVLVPLGGQGAAQGVPLQGVTALRSVTAGDGRFVIAAAAGSSSLTVFRVGADGRLTATDQLIDDLNTRFQGAAHLGAIVVDGRVFVVAAGADDGISLFTLTPAGQLVHLSTLADSLDTGLANISAIEMVRVGAEVQVIVASGAEAGLTVLRLNLANMGGVMAAQTAQASGGAGHDLLWRQAGAGSLSGGAGDDILIDGAGSDTLRGGTGADLFVLTADGTRDTIADFDPLNDRIDLSHWPMLRNTGQLSVTPTANGAILRFGNEELVIVTASGATLGAMQVAALALLPVSRVPLGGGSGTPGGDEVTGGTGADTLAGGSGDDTIYGGAGNDTMLGGAGADQHFGGTGIDWVSYAGQSSGVQVNLGQAGANTGAAQGDTFDGIEALLGTAQADVLTGDAGLNTLWGGGGNDLIAGGTGDDALDGGTGDDTLRGGSGADRLAGGDGNDLLEGDIGADQLDGGAGNDTLRGGEWSDRLAGGDGNDLLEGGSATDTLDGGLGDDTLVGGSAADMLTGGAGFDWVTWAAESAGVIVALGLAAVTGGNAAGDVLTGIEGLEGTAFADRLVGDASANGLTGLAGNDWLDGRDGDDTLLGGDGDDVTKGGIGNDRLFGGAGNDNMPGEDGDDSLDGGDGNDSLGGGNGNDTLAGGSGADGMGGGPGADLLYGGDGGDFMSGGWGLDQLWGGADGDQLAGSYDADVVWGEDGNDNIGGGTGQDSLHGGDGDDTIGAGEDADLAWGEAGNDFIGGGPGNDTLYGGGGADRLNGGPGNDVLTGGTEADTFVFSNMAPGERDTVTDFQNGIDRLQVFPVPGATAAARFASLDIGSVTISGVSYAEIAWSGHSILLAGVAPGQLDVTDFIWS